jgi:Predicted Zn-dependent hydrolases of the beta-lactamase fold
MLKLKHLSHACFEIENEKELLIIDPSDDSFGYKFDKKEVNYLCVSHDHWDHNNIQNIIVKDNAGTFNIKKVNSYHDKENGKLRGENIIHIIETNNIRVCHLGDLGHLLAEKQVEEIGKIDVLLIPVGGVFTIDYKEAIDVVNKLKPNTVIPMHYRTDKWGSDKGIDDVGTFITNIKGYKIQKLDDNNFDYKKTEEKKVYIF